MKVKKKVLVPMPTPEQQCSRCKDVFPIDKFRWFICTETYGRQCEECRFKGAASTEKFRQENQQLCKERTAESMQAWRENHPDRARWFANRWRANMSPEEKKKMDDLGYVRKKAKWAKDPGSYQRHLKRERDNSARYRANKKKKP